MKYQLTSDSSELTFYAALIKRNFDRRRSLDTSKKNRGRPLLIALGFLLIGAAAHAQGAPDAGALQQQIDRNRFISLPPKSTLLTPEKQDSTTAASGLSVKLKSIQFQGNTLLSAAQLTPSVASFLNRDLDYVQLQAAAAAAATAYREAGWVVRSYLPEQDLAEGILTIQIVESVFGSVQVDGPAAKRIRLNKVTQFINANQLSGAPLNAQAMDRGLLLADDLPGVGVTGTLRPGLKEREVDLALKLADEKLLTGDVSVDNYGSRSTGSERLNANMALASEFGLGELITTNLMHTHGSDYVRAGTTLPFGAHGWRLGANASALRYKLITPDFVALNAMGTANTLGFDASYPLVRQRHRNLYFSATVDHKIFDNQTNQSIISHYQADVLNLGVNGNAFDNLGEGGATSGNAAFSVGKLNLDGSPNQAADLNAAHTDGSFTKLRYALNRKQNLTKSLVLLASVSGQFASKNLDSSEKFYLGGSSGVRAYPASEGGGSTGLLANLELNLRISEGLSLNGFYDWGQISINRNNSFAGAPALNTYALKGAGLGLSWQNASGTSVRATWARRIGENPNPANGNDHDGSLVINRFWLTASVNF